MLEDLTEDMCEIIRSNCGRNFTNRAIKEIAKAVSRSKKGSKAFFYHIKGFIAYLSKILRYEKRDPEKISGDNYYITSNQSQEEQDIKKQEKYLSEIEYSLQVSPEWHLKKKLAAVLERAKAYDILTSFKSLDIKQNKALITVNKHVELSRGR
jgi:predicted transcriptional regulator with HTH domain